MFWSNFPSSWSQSFPPTFCRKKSRCPIFFWPISDGAIIRLQDVAQVEIGEEEGFVTARLDHTQTIFLAVWPLPGANEISIGDALYEKLDTINGQLPDGMSIDIGYDGTGSVHECNNDLWFPLNRQIIIFMSRYCSLYDL